VVIWSLLDPRLWLAALVLVGAASGVSYFKGRSDGKTICEAKHAQAVTAANVEARKIETRRQAMVDEAGRVAAARESRLRADSRRAAGESAGLRDDLRSARDYAAQSRAAAERVANVATELLGRCTESYLGVAEAAQRADSEARELRQGWPR
jgi:hypothetical protein